MKSRKVELLEETANIMATRLRGTFGSRVLGPDKPAVSRVQTFHIKKIILKIESGASLHKVREELLRIQKEVSTVTSRSVIIYYDIDPV